MLEESLVFLDLVDPLHVELDLALVGLSVLLELPPDGLGGDLGLLAWAGHAVNEGRTDGEEGLDTPQVNFPNGILCRKFTEMFVSLFGFH